MRLKSLNDPTSARDTLVHFKNEPVAVLSPNQGAPVVTKESSRLEGAQGVDPANEKHIMSALFRNGIGEAVHSAEILFLRRKPFRFVNGDLHVRFRAPFLL